MLQIGIVGGTGYTGVELIRLLIAHPEVEIKIITSRSEAGKPVSELFPNLRGACELTFSEPNIKTLSSCDLVFFATPNGTAMKMVPELLAEGVKVIDLAADFRIKDIEVWQQWYGMEHSCSDMVAEAVYGMPEINRAEIAKARLVANPGCYPTAVTLGFMPLLEAGIVDAGSLIADAKSGVSGAGRGASVANLLCETTESFKAYAVNGHRHLPEITQTLTTIMNKQVGLTFVPHLTPMVRGIEATLYARLTDSGQNLQSLYQARYENELFVDVLPEGQVPETRSVKGSNLCRMSVFQPQGGDVVVVSSVIDNLVKGAAGQAIHNMNIMCSLAENTGLTLTALLP
ncbi:MAG: N-acetyl-gamma-glutamyl-phosphate reductase [Gammaproteobacteria bacterium]|nr:N-acetyl-gamma-glutamyl-phosphate reductase [Gammaproteobacteria bacterium]